MSYIDKLVDVALEKMGCDGDRENARWVPHYHRGNKEYPDGYVCSVCGKQSCIRYDTCDGCDVKFVKFDHRREKLPFGKDGEWIKRSDSNGYSCSKCFKWSILRYDTCDGCGAIFDEFDYFRHQEK